MKKLLFCFVVHTTTISSSQKKAKNSANLKKIIK